MTILKMSLLASILIVIISVIRFFAINKLPKKTFNILWGIVMLRLLIPFSFSADINPTNVIGNVSNLVKDSPITEAITVSSVARKTSTLPMQSEKIIDTGFVSSIHWFNPFIWMMAI